MNRIRVIKTFIVTALLVVLSLSVAAPAGAWDRKYFTEDEIIAIREHLQYSVEGAVGYEYLDPHDEYGSYLTGYLGFTYQINQIIGIFTRLTGFSHSGGASVIAAEGVLFSAGATLVLADWVSSETTLSFGSNCDFLPIFRVDQMFYFTIPFSDPVSLVLGGGVFFAKFFTDSQVLGFVAGPTLYLYNWFLGYQFTYAENEPGQWKNYSHAAFAGYNLEGWFATSVTVLFGDENYVYRMLGSYELVEEDSIEVILAHRHWIGINWGLFADASWGQMTNYWDKYGGHLGLFYEF